MKLNIVKLDNMGSGISYYNDKIFFVSKTLPGEEIEASILKETTKYYRGSVAKIVKKSRKRVPDSCPFFKSCDGCHLRMLNYTDTLDYKVAKVSYLFNDKYNLEIIPSSDNYRNKIVVRIAAGVLGYYEEETNNITKIKSCNNAKLAINNFLNDYQKLGIKNGKLTIRCNYNDELLIIIESKDKVNLTNLTNHKIVGIILNDKLIHGQDNFMEIINKNIFKVSSNSFFQINNEMNAKLHNLITANINNNQIVLDLYCGVGSLSIPAARVAKKVYGVDNSSSNIKDALLNSKINKLDNLFFLLGDASLTIKKINDKIDVVIVDPPRKGLDKEGIKNILGISPKQIIYVSCDPLTLKRDIKLLINYEIKEIKLLDMFPYTYHVETVVLMSRVEK